MSPELAAALDQIGWAHVRGMAPAYALHLERRLLDRSRDDRPYQAREDIKHVAKLRTALLGLLESLEALSLASRDLIDWFSWPRPIEPGAMHPFATQLVAAAEAIVPGVIELEEALVADAARVPKTGHPRNLAAFRIADVLVEIFVIGRGERPGKGKSYKTNAATGDLGRVAREVFRILEVRVSDTSVEPLHAAIDSLTDERFARLLDYRSGARRREPPSLFDMIDRGKPRD